MPIKREQQYESEEEYEDAMEEDEHLSSDDGVEAAAVEERGRSNQGAGPSGGTGTAGPAYRSGFFAKGAIKQVKVHDFMTYTGTVTIRPGARLNLVIGPNGTGKSSFVCAVCIGLGGSPKILGRADDLKDFVRRGGPTSFWTEITLSSGGEGRDHVIKRIVTTRKDRNETGASFTRYDSKWMINGRDANAKQVDNLVVKQLKIQFDNLCQFLPQDKVVEFAKMDKFELLAATEKALGDSSLYDQHQSLVKLRKDEKLLSAERDKSAANATKLTAKQEEQRREYERFKQREKLLGEAKALRRQAKWIEVAAKVKAAAAAKKRFKEARDDLRKVEQEHAEDERPMKELEGKGARLRQSKIELERDTRDADQGMRRALMKIRKHDEDTQRLGDELGALEEMAKKRQDDIDTAQRRLDKAKADLADAPEHLAPELVTRDGEIRTLVASLKRDKRDIQENRNIMDAQAQAIQADIGRVRARLDTLNSRKYQLLQRLEAGQNGIRNISKLYEWVEQHRTDGTFHGPVFGPIALELSVNAVPEVPHARVLQYVESSCWFWLGAFLVTCKDDEARLFNQAKLMGAFQVKVAACTHDPATPFYVEHPAGHASQHGRYGLMHTVDELIQAPPIVMHALVKMCKVNQYYIGNEHATRFTDKIAAETSINFVLVPNAKITVLRSRYSAGARSIVNDSMYANRVLGAGGGSEEDAEREALLAEDAQKTQAHDALAATLNQLDHKMEQHTRQEDDLNREGHAIVTRHQAVVQKRNMLKAAERNAAVALAHKQAVPDPQARRPLIMHALSESTNNHVDMLREAQATIQAACKAMRRSQLLELALKEVSAQFEAMKEGRKHRENVVQAARNAVQDTENAFRATETDAKRSQQTANEHFALTEEDKDEVRRFEAESKPAGEVLQEAEKKEAEAEAIVINNTDVNEVYRKRQRDIDALKAALEEQELQLQQMRASIVELKDLWLPQIREMVTTMNMSFSKNFKEIGCAGEVRLHEEEDFDKFAIEIMVQFRVDEEMKLLTANHQSGGERSVSTILYLIALQSVTETAFRVVDEINQGMDAHNERKVFHQLVHASTEADTPQCFLLTPKLLNDLDYSRDITILQIMNSSTIEPDLIASHNAGKKGMLGKRRPLDGR